MDTGQKELAGIQLKTSSSVGRLLGRGSDQMQAKAAENEVCDEFAGVAFSTRRSVGQV